MVFYLLIFVIFGIQAEEFTKNKPYLEKGRYRYSKSEVPFREGVIDAIKLHTYLATSKAGCPIVPYPITHSELQEALFHSGPVIVPMGHATVLIAFGDRVILADPIFWKHHAPWIRRQVKCTPSPKWLPPITDVIISHSHPDHCDVPSLRYIHKKNPNVALHVPEGMRDLMLSIGIKDVKEYTWWDELVLDEWAALTFLPAHHWGMRSLFDRNKVLWGSWMIALREPSDNKEWNIYFSGDTASGEHFKTIHHYFPNIDCALLPIDPISPAQVHLPVHMTPEQAIDAWKELGKPLFIPIHWGVFRTGYEPSRYALEKLIDEMHQQKEDLNSLVGFPMGKPVALQ